MNAAHTTQLDIEDILSRSSRSRQALLDALGKLPEGRFQEAPADEWSPAQVLRHVVWVEYYWTGIARLIRAGPQDPLDLDEAIRRTLFAETCRAAGTPPEPVADPPPYATEQEAVQALEDSRRGLRDTVRSLSAENFQRRFSSPRGVATLRFAIEHIIEHDWDHAVQITGLSP